MERICKMNQIEWHDLPVESFSISDSAVCLVVTPYDDARNAYRNFTLRLSKFTSMTVSLGEFDSRSLKRLEVADFSFKDSGVTISGEIGILPGDNGYWTISFEDAFYEFYEAGKA